MYPFEALIHPLLVNPMVLEIDEADIAKRFVDLGRYFFPLIGSARQKCPKVHDWDGG